MHPEEGSKADKGLEDTSCEEQLRTLGSSTQEKGD